MKNLKRTLLAVAISTISLNASATMLAVGPPNLPSPPGNGFPAWYEDDTGLFLDQCIADANDPGGLQLAACLLNLSPEIPPYVFPSNYPVETFYFRATSKLALGNKKMSYVSGVEGSFGTGVVLPGQQVTFTRIRIMTGVPEDGTYTVTHPYGKEVFNDVVAGSINRDIFWTEDTGLGAVGDFTVALSGRVGPFLERTDQAGNKLGPVTLNGAQFLSDGVGTEFVTNSPFGTNYVLVCGKTALGNDIILGTATADGTALVGGTCAREDTFSLTGRLHDHVAKPIPTPLTFGGTTYDRDATGTYIDAYAKVGRQVAGAPAPILTAAGANFTPVKMVGPNSKNEYYAQDIVVPNGEVPSLLTVTNNAVNPTSSVQTKVVDVVTVNSADYNPTTNILTVTANSSDKGYGTSPAPSLIVLGYPTALPVPAGDPLDPSIVAFDIFLPAGSIPPDTITVQSSAGGLRTLHVGKGLHPKFSNPGAPYAADDSFPVGVNTLVAGSAAVTIPVVANDRVNALTPITADSLKLVTLPKLGIAAVLPGNVLTYTPGSQAGQDTFTYSIANAIGQSNNATVIVDIVAPVGGPLPSAVADGPINVIKLSTKVIDVLANDKGNGGTLNPASVTIVPGSVVGGVATVNTATGAVNFVAGNVANPLANATTAGTAGFDYTVANTSAQRSVKAHVAVNVASPEVVAIAAGSQCVARQNKWTMSGTSTATANNIITFYNTSIPPVNPLPSQIIGNVSVGLATAATGAGAWTLTAVGAAGAPACVTPISYRTSYGSTRNSIAVGIK